MPLPNEKSVVLLHGVFADKDTRHMSRVTRLKSGKDHFFILEGRPNLQAALESSKALLKFKQNPTLISDNMAGFLFYKNLVKEIRLAYHHVDSTGALCDIGALILGVLGKRHNVPVNLYPGKIKTRFLGNPKDLLSFQGKAISPKGAKGYVPLVEWLPKKYISKVF